MPASNVSSCPPGGAMAGMEPTVDTVAVQPIPAYLYYALAGGGALLLMVTVTVVVVLCCHRYHWATKKTSRHHSVLYHSNQQLSQQGHLNYYQNQNPAYNMVCSHNHLHPGNGPSLDPMLTIRLEKDKSGGNQCWNLVLGLLKNALFEVIAMKLQISAKHLFDGKNSTCTTAPVADDWSQSLSGRHLCSTSLALPDRLNLWHFNFWQGEKIKDLPMRAWKHYCSLGNICSWSWKWKGLRNTSHTGFLPGCGHKNTHALCNVSLVTACFPLYGCLSCSDLKLGRCQPPNTLSNRGGIYTGTARYGPQCTQHKGTRLFLWVSSTRLWGRVTETD